MGKLFADASIIAMTAFISPYRVNRNNARKLHTLGKFIEVFVDAPLSVLEDRDPKGMYKKARAGQITEFTGISAPYKAPENLEIHLDTSKMDVQECADAMIQYLEEQVIIPS